MVESAFTFTNLKEFVTMLSITNYKEKNMSYINDVGQFVVSIYSAHYKYCKQNHSTANFNLNIFL